MTITLLRLQFLDAFGMLLGCFWDAVAANVLLCEYMN